MVCVLGGGREGEGEGKRGSTARPGVVTVTIPLCGLTLCASPCPRVLHPVTHLAPLQFKDFCPNNPCDCHHLTHEPDRIALREMFSGWVEGRELKGAEPSSGASGEVEDGTGAGRSGAGYPGGPEGAAGGDGSGGALGHGDHGGATDAGGVDVASHADMERPPCPFWFEDTQAG